MREKVLKKRKLMSIKKTMFLDRFRILWVVFKIFTLKFKIKARKKP